MHRSPGNHAPVSPRKTSPPVTFPSESTKPRGTLMWVGPRFSLETIDAYHYCESQADQIAYRPTIEDALQRPASAVTQILIHRGCWQAELDPLVDQLAAAYPLARMLEMYGSLWEGQRRTVGSPAASRRFYWYRWNQVLPDWIDRGSSQHDLLLKPIGSPHCSVAIMAGTFSAAEPLMEIATSAGATAMWCRTQTGLTARNFSVVWWDDSVANEAPAQVWRQRMAAVAQHSPQRPLQIWITRAPRVHAYRQARQAGIDMVLSKPYQIEVLASTLRIHRLEHPIGMSSERFRSAA